MSWRNTDRAFGSRARGLRGVSTDGLAGFVPPGTVPTMRWRNTDRAWGNRPRGLPFTGRPSGPGFTGPGMAGLYDGLGQDQSTVALDAGGFPVDTSGSSTTTLSYPGMPAGAGTGYDIATPVNAPNFPPTAPSQWPSALTNIAQAGFTDAYKILQLLNPVPPGTVMQTGPGGTYISRAAPGQPTPTGFPSVGGTGGGLIWILGIGAVVLLLARGRG